MHNKKLRVALYSVYIPKETKSWIFESNCGLEWFRPSCLNLSQAEWRLVPFSYFSDILKERSHLRHAEDFRQMMHLKSCLLGKES